MINLVKPALLLGICFSASLAATAQDTLSLESCYELARENYPLTQKQDLITTSSDYTLQNIEKGNLPQLTVLARASYQSDVTRIPIHSAGFRIPELSKDQYRVYGALTQKIYDGGALGSAKALADVEGKIAGQQLEVQLYQLKARINQLFFGILLIDKKIAQHALYQNDIHLGILKVTAAVQNGAALHTDLDKLEAEWLQAGQQATALHAERRDLAEMLGAFIHQKISDSSRLIAPFIRTDTSQIRRPELALFRYQVQRLDVEDQLNAALNRPRVDFFLDGGLGRPGLDMLDNHFKGYYLAGVEMTIPLSRRYTRKGKSELIDLNRQKIASDRATFLFNTRLSQQSAESSIDKFRAILSSDDRIILLRNRIKKASLAQLEGGIITSDDYLRNVHAADRAHQQKAFHEVQLLMAAYTQRRITGY